MINRPTEFPDWALTDVIDPLEQTPNVINPPNEKKQVGWVPHEVVPNNYLNWLHRRTNEWLKYLDQQVPHEPFSQANKPAASSFAAGKMIYISDLGTGGSMAFSDGTNWRKVSDNTIITE